MLSIVSTFSFLMNATVVLWSSGLLVYWCAGLLGTTVDCALADDPNNQSRRSARSGRSDVKYWPFAVFI